MATRPDSSARDPFYRSRSWLLGDGRQKEWARFVASRGNVVLPTYAMSDEDSNRTKAPLLFAPDGKLLVAPDALVLNRERRPVWHEVKAKTTPTWYYKRQRWEHGFDHALVREYLQVEAQTGAPVFIVVHEEGSPLDPERPTRLVPAGLWLLIPLWKALALGELRPEWPGGRGRPSDRGRRGAGGLLWPRREMERVVLCPPPNGEAEIPF